MHYGALGLLKHLQSGRPLLYSKCQITNESFQPYLGDALVLGFRHGFAKAVRYHQPSRVLVAVAVVVGRLDALFVFGAV